MEFFGFASGSSKTGPAFPDMPEAVLNAYPNTLLEHPALPTAAVGFLSLEAPDARNCLLALQAWVDSSLALLDRPGVKAVGVGLSASVCFYGAWRLSQRWNDNISHQTYHGSPLIRSAPRYTEPHPEGGTIDFKLVAQEDEDEEPVTAENAQRQLSDTRAKLEELRYHLNRLEGEKDMLAAEVSMRKKIVAQLHGEISSERDKRQHAELRMEMMEWENTHLRRLRKDVAAKEGKIDQLHASLREKEELQDKLLRENVILPKTIAAARAKEYETLRATVQRFEMEAAMRRSDYQYKVTGAESFSCASGQPLVEESFETKSAKPSSVTSPATCTPSSERSFCSAAVPFPSNAIARAKNIINTTANWSNSVCGDQQMNTHVSSPYDSEEQTTLLHSKQMHINEPALSNMGPELTHVARDLLREVNESSSQTLRRHQATSPIRPARREDWSGERSPSEDPSGVLGHIRSFFGGFSHNGSDYDLGTTPGSPAQLGDVLSSQSHLWSSKFEDKANNSCSRQGETEDDGECDMSVSDCQSSIFMSASCGSGSSNEDVDELSQDQDVSLKKAQPARRASSARTKASERVKSPEKVRSSKRVTSPTKAESRKRVTSSVEINMAKRFSNHIRAKSHNREIQPQVGLVPTSTRKGYTSAGVRPFDKIESVDRTISIPKKDGSLADTEPHTTIQEKIAHQSRARQRYRMRQCRPNYPSNSIVSKDDYASARMAYPSIPMPMWHERANGNAKMPALPFLDRHRAASVGNEEDTNKNSVDGMRSDSEESWIVIKPAD